MTNMFVMAALVERLRRLLNDESKVIPKVNDDFLDVREQLKKIMEDANANDEITDHQVNSARKIMTYCCDLEDLVESYLSETGPRRNRNMILNRISLQIEVIKTRITSIQQASRPSDTQQKHQPEVNANETEETTVMTADDVRTEETTVMTEDDVQTEETIVEMDDAAKRLVPRLTGKPDHLDMICIHGTPGIGKSTLARRLYEHVSKKFDVSVRVYVPHFMGSDWIKIVFLQILDATSNNSFDERRGFMDMEEEQIAELVYKRLKRKRYLIVLDDVRSADTWLSLRMVFPDDGNRSRVLITTRDVEVAKQVGGHIHTVKPLSDQNIWDLFRRELKIEETDSNAESELELIREQILTLCGGVPSTVEFIAFSLSRSQSNEWKNLLEETAGRVLNGVESKYKNLPLHLRPCLLYLCSFPIERGIEWDTARQLWIAEGLISMEDIENGETMMDIAARYLDELARRDLVIIEDQFSGQRRFKSCMIKNYNVRKFCETRAKKDEFFEVTHFGNEDQNKSSSIRRAIDLDKYEHTHPHQYGNAPDYLRSLLLFTSNKSKEGMITPRQIPNLDDWVCLRVLYLYCLDFKDGKLPKGVEELVYLRYLGFKECYLEEFPSLGSNMDYLQTLDLRVRNECEMTIADVFNNFKRLKFLYFPLAYRTFNNKQLCLEEVKELEILDNFDTSVCNVQDLRSLTNLKELTVTTKGDASEILKVLENNTREFRSISLNIRNFDCHSITRFSAMEKVFKSSALNVLEVEGYLGVWPKLDMTSSKLTKITLNGSELVEDPMQKLHELPNLTILVLEIEASIKENMKCSSSGFCELRYLKLLKLYKLKSWKVKKEAMPSLHTLVIENCKELKSWVVEETAMPSLHTLVIKNCKNLPMLPDGLKCCESLQILEIASMPDAFVKRIRESDGTEGEDYYKIRHVQPFVNIDGQNYFIMKKRKQGKASKGFEVGGKGGDYSLDCYYLS